MIKFGEKATDKEIQSVFPSLKKNKMKKREVKYVYVHTEIIEEFLPGFYLEWGISSCGFGQLIFSTQENKLSIDTEGMSLSDLLLIIDFLKEEELNLPEISSFLQKYGYKNLSYKNQLKEILNNWFINND